MAHSLIQLSAGNVTVSGDRTHSHIVLLQGHTRTPTNFVVTSRYRISACTAPETLAADGRRLATIVPGDPDVALISARQVPTSHVTPLATPPLHRVRAVAGIDD